MPSLKPIPHPCSGLSSIAVHASHKGRGRIEPIRSQAEYLSIPDIDVAVGFAEALNMASLKRLGEVLSEEVSYQSNWRSIKLKGRERVKRWFGPKLLGTYVLAVGIKTVSSVGRYRAQIVILPDGRAGVLVETVPHNGVGLVRFEAKDGLARRVIVTGKFDRRALRETLYCPPDA